MQNTETSVYRNSASSIGLTTNERHRLLQSLHRRLAVAVLSERTPPVDLDELALATVDQSVEEESASLTVRESTISLHHAHLPLMDDLGVLEYDPQTNRVRSHVF